jgi:hypothetical protein
VVSQMTGQSADAVNRFHRLSRRAVRGGPGGSASTRPEVAARVQYAIQISWRTTWP